MHPFIDGNGRAGRLVLNLNLVRLGYPPAIILKSHRQRYLNSVHKADAKDVTLAALRQAAQRGRLRAIQTPDGTWQATRQYVNDYPRIYGKHRNG